MHASQRVSDAILQVTLPMGRGEDIPMPMARPVNVHLLTGASPAIVDTGHVRSREALREALLNAGVQPERVRRVLLTGGSALHVGNLELFPEATIVAAPALAECAAWWRSEVEYLGVLATRLQAHPDAPQGWADVDVEARLATLLPPPLPSDAERLFVEEGAYVAAGTLQLETLHAPGSDPAGCAYFDASSRTLFPGRALYLRGTPDYRDVSLGIRGMDRLAQLDVERCLPMVGPPEDAWLPAIRGASLQVHGALANLPYAFAGPTGPVELARMDVGEMPADLLHFAHRVRWYAALLAELVEAGVVEREGDDPLAPCTGGSAQGSRSARLTRQRR